MYTTAEDWLERFEAAGFAMEVHADTIRPVGAYTWACETLWDEIRPSASDWERKWREVEALIRERAGPFREFTFYPAPKR